MAKIKTSELEGAALDWVVAKCEGDLLPIGGAMLQTWPKYSTDWAQGGPIIEKCGFCLAYVRAIKSHHWRASISEHVKTRFYGETPLIAAMRCYVAIKFGDEVEIPDELI